MANSSPRKITLLPLIAATFFMVSGGPFGIEDTVSKAGYAGAMLILLITPVIWSLPTALMVSELASALPEEGGYYVWARRALGPFWGFQQAWLYLMASIFDVAIYPTLFVGYLGHFAPAVTAGARGPCIAVALLAASAAWNLLGARSIGGSSVVMGILLLSPFAVLTAYAFFHHGDFTAAAAPLNHRDYLGGLLVAMWNYMAWENSSTVAGEVDRPQRTYPLAMAGAVALVTLNYVLPVGAVAATGIDPNSWTTSGWASVATLVFRGGTLGAIAAAGMTAGGILGAVGTLNAQVMSFSRLPAAMAEDGYLPRIFARQLRTGAPWVSIVVCCAVWALSLGLSFTKLIVLDVLLTGSAIVLEFASLVALRIREPKLARPYRVPGGLAGAVAIGVLPFALLVLAMLRNEVEPIGPINALQFGALLMTAGVAAYFAGRRFQKRNRAH